MSEHYEESNQESKHKDQKEWYKKPWGIVLAILIWPYFLIWYIWAKTKLDKKLKIGATVGISLVLLIALASVNSNSTQTTQNNAPTTKTEQKTTETKKEEAKPEATKPAPAPKGYVQVFAFSGNGQKKSEPFTITGERFKVKYNCSGNLCQAWASRVGSSYSMESIMNTTQTVKDETTIYGSGEYYIESNSIGAWSMTVEDYK